MHSHHDALSKGEFHPLGRTMSRIYQKINSLVENFKSRRSEEFS
jgi:hypothetical protein